MNRCEVCHLGLMLPPPDGQESYVLCTECGSIELNYIPLPHQEVYHRDPHQYKMFAGGYGSGKTRTGAEEVIQHILNTPNGCTFIGAQTKNQLDQTAKDMFFKCFPKPLIEDYHKQRDELICKNGHKVLFRPCDDETKIRSLNLTCFWIEECSEVKYDIFVQLMTRLRHQATEHHQGILTSNPDMGWIRTEFLYKSHEVFNAERNYFVDLDEQNAAFSVHIAPTHLNYKHLPPNYEEMQSRGKPDWWIRRYLKGSFEFSEGQVFPMAAEYIIQPFHIPDHWERVFGCDVGVRDPLAFLAGAIDPKEGVLHIYQEHYEALKTIKHHAKKIHEMVDPIAPGLIRYMVCDPSMNKRSPGDLKTTYDHFAEYGIYFKEAYNRIESGIFKLYSYFDLGNIRIHANCTNTIREVTNYKYKPIELGTEKNLDEKPIDKDNHTCDALRYLVNELPDDPENLKSFSVFVSDYYGQGRSSGVSSSLPFALQDDVDPYTSMEWGDYY